MNIITRREFVKATLATTAGYSLMPHNLFAATGTAKNLAATKTLVVLFLRGGMDGLNLIIPYKDENYYELRSSIAIPKPGEKNGAIDIDGTFALHPSAEALKPFFNSGELTALQGVGYSGHTRSHFKEQDVWETGMAKNSLRSDGWLNRHLATTSGNGHIRAISVGSSLPRILRGKVGTYAIRSLSDITLPGSKKSVNKHLESLENAYDKTDDTQSTGEQSLITDIGKRTIESMKILSDIGAKKYKPVNPYPTTTLGKQLKTAARLIKANIGLEIVEIDYGGWDTHQSEGNVTGTFANKVKELSDAMAAFQADMKKHQDKVMLMTMSEFGRTAAQNGTGGTDHGWANCMLLMGGAIKQKKTAPISGTWPGLAPDQLNAKRDLMNTTDFRDILCEIVTKHLGNKHPEMVIPNHKIKPLGIIA